MKITYKKSVEKKVTLTKTDANDLMTMLYCAFQDDKLAQCGQKERTLFNTNLNLSKIEMSVRFYLGDVGPAQGTNQMKTRIREPFTFGFK